MTDFKKELSLVLEIVKTATFITEWFSNIGFESYQKEDNSPVTLADYASQIYITNKMFSDRLSGMGRSQFGSGFSSN